MPRVTKKQFLFAWIASIGIAGFLGMITLIFFYIPFLTHTFSNPTEINYISDLYSIDLSFYKIDIMDMTFICLLIFFAIPAFYYRKDYKWRKEVDSYLPYLLREISDAQKVGLPLPRAIIEAGKRNYGPLTDELRMMSSKISWGIPFGEGLREMATNIDTDLFRQTSILILEAERSGGQTDEIFESAYSHVNEILGLERERLTAMASYKWIIMISFVVFAFVIVILLNSFFVELAIQGATSGETGEEAGFTGLPMNLALLQLLFFHLLMIEGSFSGLIAGKMSTGDRKSVV